MADAVVNKWRPLLSSVVCFYTPICDTPIRINPRQPCNVVLLLVLVNVVGERCCGGANGDDVLPL
ncbi:Uncharacterised protein [Vibrio cholerae]|nr:Uncharacterised protein [Vibrio cholerae]